MLGSRWPKIPTCSLSNNKTLTWQNKQKTQRLTSSPRPESSSNKARCRRPCSAWKLKYRKMNRITKRGNSWANSTKSLTKMRKPFLPSNKLMRKIHMTWTVCWRLELVSQTSSLKKMPSNTCTHGLSTTQTSKRLQMLKDKTSTLWKSKTLSWLLTSRIHRMRMSSQLWEL